VHDVRFADADGVKTTPINPEQLLEARCAADQGNDLWLTFNRVQENVIRGGLHRIVVENVRVIDARRKTRHARNRRSCRLFASSAFPVIPRCDSSF